MLATSKTFQRSSGVQRGVALEKLWLVGDGFQYLLCGVGVYSEDRAGDCHEDVPVRVVVLPPLHGDFIAKLF